MTLLIYKKDRTCFDNCVLKQMVETCLWHYPEYYNFGSKVVCSTQEQMICSFITYNRVYSRITENCGDFCPQECETTEFVLTTSTLTFPTDAYANEILQNSFIKIKYPNMTLDELKSNLLAVNIYYPELKYTV